LRIERDGVVIDANIIGNFKINEREFSVCSYVDSEANAKIIIIEIERVGSNIITKDIPDEDMEFVLDKYKEIESILLESGE